MGFYEAYKWNYLAADAKTRAEAKAHWIKCHEQNIASGREDMMIYSAQILAAIALAEALRTRFVKA